jgi:hypothetical protein
MFAWTQALHRTFLLSNATPEGSSMRVTSITICVLLSASWAWSQDTFTNPLQPSAGWTPSQRSPRQPALHQSTASSGVRLASGEDSLNVPSLPSDDGQSWQEYDISGFTQLDPSSARPEQAIVDWILRDTGTEIWFREPLGVLSAGRNTIRVYQTAELQAKVAEVVDRFVNAEAVKQAFSVKMVTIVSPNWRARAMHRMIPVAVQTPGVEAWLLSRENAAVVYDEMRRRTDFREYSSPNLLVRNGQTHEINRHNPVAYVRAMRAVPTVPGGYQIEMGQVEEGFSLALSPLLASDRRTIDAVIRLESTQVEKLNNLAVPTPTMANAKQTSQIQVPQTSSWRLHERFHWPADDVLLISCGVVSSPGPDRASGLNLGRLTSGPPRADALIFVETKGRFSNLVAAPQSASANGELGFRGRY